MKMFSNTIIILLIAVFEFLWLQDASVRAAPFLDDLDFSRFDHNLSERFPVFPSFPFFRRNRTAGFDAPDKTREGKKGITYLGSITIQRNNVYRVEHRNGTVYGSRDIQIGNTYSGDPDATIVYRPILVQENNTYGGKNENAQYGASVLRAGNSYDHNLGKNDIHPKVIQSNNTYQ